MYTWLMENMATIVVGAVLMIAAAAVIAGMVRSKRKGKSSCGCGCSGCPAGSMCAMSGVRNPGEQESAI